MFIFGLLQFWVCFLDLRSRKRHFMGLSPSIFILDCYVLNCLALHFESSLFTQTLALRYKTSLLNSPIRTPNLWRVVVNNFEGPKCASFLLNIYIMALQKHHQLYSRNLFIKVPYPRSKFQNRVLFSLMIICPVTSSMLAGNQVRRRVIPSTKKQFFGHSAMLLKPLESVHFEKEWLVNANFEPVNIWLWNGAVALRGYVVSHHL